MNLETNERGISVQTNCFSIMKIFLCITVATLCSGSALRVKTLQLQTIPPEQKIFPPEPPIDACLSREYQYFDSCCCPLIWCPPIFSLSSSRSCGYYSNICCCPRRHCPTLPPITLPPTTLPPTTTTPPPPPPCPPNPSL